MGRPVARPLALADGQCWGRGVCGGSWCPPLRPSMVAAHQAPNNASTSKQETGTRHFLVSAASRGSDEHPSTNTPRGPSPTSLPLI